MRWKELSPRRPRMGERRPDPSYFDAAAARTSVVMSGLRTAEQMPRCPLMHEAMKSCPASVRRVHRLS